MILLKLAASALRRPRSAIPLVLLAVSAWTVVAGVSSAQATGGANVLCNVVPGVQAQLTAEQQFTQIQIALTNLHVETLHEDDDQITDQRSGGPVPSNASGYADPNSAPSVASAPASKMIAAYFPPGPGPAARPAAGEFAIWSSNQAQFGAYNGGFLQSSGYQSFYSVAGIDRRFSSAFKMGVALGVGSQHANIGSDGSSLQSTIVTGTLYGTYRIAPRTFVDGQIGYGGGSTSTTRTIGQDGSTATGSRGASVLFGSATVSHDFYVGDLRLSPLARANLYRISLAPYAEQGSAFALSYQRLTSADFVGVIGLRAEYPIAMSWGFLTPRLRAEYQHSFSGGYNQTFNYAVLLGATPTTFSGPILSQNQFVTRAGLRLATLQQFSCDVEYAVTTASHGVQGQSVRLAVGQRF